MNTTLMPRFWIIHPHAPKDLTTVIKHAKNYKVAIEEANHTKLVNLAIRKTSSAAEKKIDQLTKKDIGNKTAKISTISLLFFKTPIAKQLLLTFSTAAILTTSTNLIVSTTTYTTKSSKTAVLRSNSFNNIILPAQIAQNANLSDIFPFEFKANKSLFLLSNAAVNEQKAITVMYTKAELRKNVDRPAQTVFVTANGMKKTPVEKIDNFPFTIDKITIPVKELKISYQEQYTRVFATCGIFNKKSEKASVFEFEEKKELPVTETFMVFGSTSNWAEKTEQTIFEKTKGWNTTLELQKQLSYILLKYKDYNKKLSSIKAYISPEEEYETYICYYCKACHRKRFEYSKQSGK
ncbi:hypothetical protein G9A89_012127 [Geosiphon pyriformis]|nr:hypothetical protein G9A89_012127 [Geosiphon pyriformis]